MTAARADLDEVRLLRPLGGGAMGDVFLGHDTVLDRPVAVKFLREARADAVARERFLTEARAIARLAHPNVVAIYRVGEIDGRPYLVSEFVAGASLDRCPLPLGYQTVLGIAVGLARGLAAAHRRGVLHRDIKPANVILAESGEVKLLDFGLAKLADGGAGVAAEGGAGVAVSGKAIARRPVAPRPASAAVDLTASLIAAPEPAPGAEGGGWLAGNGDPGAAPDAGAAALNAGAAVDSAGAALTGAGALLGTPRYLAPELWRGEPASARSDLYALGALLFELCAGRPLRPEPTLAALREAALAGSTAALAELPAACDPRFVALLGRCLGPDPAARPASADELCAELERLQASERVQIPEGNPYRGLRAFQADYRALFFGRERDARVVLELLAGEPVVVVTGDSGVGKSSLCRAGVLPEVERGALSQQRRFRALTLVPGPRPLRSLSEALAPLLPDGAGLEQLLAGPDGPALLGPLLARHLGPREGALLFVDQLEELLTQADPAEAARFGEILGHLGARAPHLRALLSARGDYLSRLAGLPGLAEVLGRALHLLGPLPPQGLREAIVGPARQKGVRFESDALVEQLAASGAAEGGLPLLQFALAELWEARDQERGLIPAAALDAIGGVAGALSRHADGVLRRVAAADRAHARRMLLRLVSADGARLRRTAAELDAEGGPAAAVLEALVGARLLTAGGDEPATYEVAHEALLRGWGTLRDWLDEDGGRRAVRERLAAAAAEWRRLEQSREALWGERQLRELAAAAVAEDELPSPSLAFLRAARAAVRRRRLSRVATLLGAPLLALGIYGGLSLRARAEQGRAIAGHLREADGALVEARRERDAFSAARREAFAGFDRRETEAAEAAWVGAHRLGAQARAAYRRAAAALEAAVLLDSDRTEARARLAQVLYEQALLAEIEGRAEQQGELLGRLRAYDDRGELGRRWLAPAELSVEIDPPGARVSIRRYDRDPSDPPRRALSAPIHEGPAPLRRALPPGSYLVELTAADRAPVRYPVLLARDERHRVALRLPAAREVPPGYVYIPPGRFLFGSTHDEDFRRSALTAQPQHEVSLPGYLIGRTEVTIGAWIEYLRALPPAERRLRLPSARGHNGDIELRETPGGFALTLRPPGGSYAAGPGEPIRYAERGRRAEVDWSRLPVSGVSWEDALAYVAWLDRSGRVPGARLCDEREWERAARGADDRLYPHGDRLRPDEADIDLTYGRRPGGFGPDEVGAHPISDSPFGVADLAGNVWEWTRSSSAGAEIYYRGGGWYEGAASCLSVNRQPGEPAMRNITNGVRVCATFPVSGRP